MSTKRGKKAGSEASEGGKEGNKKKKKNVVKMSLSYLSCQGYTF